MVSRSRSARATRRHSFFSVGSADSTLGRIFHQLPTRTPATRSDGHAPVTWSPCPPSSSALGTSRAPPPPPYRRFSARPSPRPRRLIFRLARRPGVRAALLPCERTAAEPPHVHPREPVHDGRHPRGLHATHVTQERSRRGDELVVRNPSREQTRLLVRDVARGGGGAPRR